MRSLFLTAISFGLSALGCSFGSTPGAQAGWSRHSDPAGFDVEMPSGWTSSAAKDGHVVLRSGDKSSFALLQPFKLENGGSAEESLRTLIGHMKDTFPAADITGVSQVSSQPDEVAAKISFGSNRANALCYVSGGAGMLYVVASSAGQFASRVPTLVKILRSFQYTGTGGGSETAAGGSASGPVTYTTFTDPKESAFTTEVPAGWKVVGGLYRFAPIDVRKQVNVASPDGQVQVKAGDARVSTYVPYGPSAQVRGLHEGQFYQVNGITYTIMHPMDGAEFTRKYAEIAVKLDHPDVKIGESKDRPDMETWIEQKLGSSSGKLSAGETDFSFTDHGRQMQGAVVGVTVNAGQVWFGLPATVYATPNRLEQGLDVLVHIFEHTEDSQDWAAKQRETTAQFNQLIIQNHEAAMAQIRETYERFTHWLDENNRAWTNIINNTVDVKDASGNVFKAEAGHNYYWTGAGGVVGSDTKSAPDVNLSPLEKF
jgi:hypothetical protein